jgi:hypothetical protein
MVIALVVIGLLGLHLPMDVATCAIIVETMARKNATPIVEIHHKGGTMSQDHS